VDCFEGLPVLYASEITHTRRAPLHNRFHYRSTYWLVDADQLPLRRGPWGSFVRLEASDHCDVREVLAETGVVPARVLLLAMPRTLGYVFNPISVFWAYDDAGECLAVVAEVNNTYGGRHAYVLSPSDLRNGSARVDKEMYVSPFYPVDGSYEIRVSEPGAMLSLRVSLHREGQPSFVATLRGERRRANIVNMVWASLVHSALRTSFLIRWQAIRLRLRGVRIEPR
jgi:DUF1365 family protein